MVQIYVSGCTRTLGNWFTAAVLEGKTNGLADFLDKLQWACYSWELPCVRIIINTCVFNFPERIRKLALHAYLSILSVDAEPCSCLQDGGICAVMENKIESEISFTKFISFLILCSLLSSISICFSLKKYMGKMSLSMLETETPSAWAQRNGW